MKAGWLCRFCGIAALGGVLGLAAFGCGRDHPMPPDGRSDGSVHDGPADRAADHPADTPSADLALDGQSDGGPDRDGGLPGDGPITPENSGIEHIVVLMMENRSFDHVLGWLPNADGKQAGLSYPDSAGRSHPTYPLAPDWTGCGHVDPDHSYQGGRVEYDNGMMDGFLRAAHDDPYPIGYYVEQDRPFFAALARNYTALDRYFASILAETFPNRFFFHAAQTDRLTGDITPFSTLPTIWDRLKDAGVSATYYSSDLPFLFLWGTKYNDITVPYTQFISDAQAGTLPAVSVVDPAFNNESAGTSRDDHPFADVRVGDAFMAQTFLAVARGPLWSKTVFILTYDEWGGFFDHVPPPRAAAPNDIDTDVVNGKTLLGLRVPCIVASPFSKGDPQNPRINSTVFDHTSILKLIEWRYNLQPLTARDASNDIGNLLEVLDLRHPNPALPDLPEPTAPPVVACPTADGGPDGSADGPDGGPDASTDAAD